MKEQSVTGNAYMQRGAGVKCSAETGIGKKQYRYFIIVTAVFLLLIGSVFSSPLFAAVPDAQKAAIAAGVAAGTDVSVILQNAVAAGMTTEQAVKELVLAGADPGRVVYEAITAKYSSEDVVKGAAAAVLNRYCPDKTITTTACTSQMSLVVSAAQQAGASTGDINGWIAGAGAPAPLIASANTQASENPAPVEGYTGPTAGTALTSIIGGGGGPIGGSSIGSPTQPASRTTP